MKEAVLFLVTCSDKNNGLKCVQIKFDIKKQNNKHWFKILLMTLVSILCCMTFRY